VTKGINYWNDDEITDLGTTEIPPASAPQSSAFDEIYGSKSSTHHTTLSTIEPLKAGRLITSLVIVISAQL
jgi:hypothetical protein